MARNLPPDQEALRTFNPVSGAPRTKPAPGVTGGRVSQTPGWGPAVTGLATGVGAQIAGNQVANAIGTSSNPAWTQGASGMAAGMGIGMAGNYAANKLKPKEEMPTIPDRHSALNLGGYGRRLEGAGPGLAGGAVRGATMGANPALAASTGGLSIAAGALGGLIAGAATKNAPSAYSDYSATDADNIIRNAYKNYLGRDASDQEVLDQLTGQGYQAGKGHRWVGEKGLYSVLDSIQDSEEAKAYLQRQGQAPQPTTTPAPQASQSPATNTPAVSSGQRELVEKFGVPPGGRTGAQTEPLASYNSLSSPNPSGPLANNPNTGITGGMGLSQQGIESSPASPASPSPSWNTDGFMSPQFTAQNFGGPLSGWDATKWNNTDHQTPKYVWGRIASSNMGEGGLNVAQAVSQFLQAYPGATFDGKDKFTIPGVGVIDALGGSSIGQNTPQWLDTAAASQTPAQGGMPSFGGPSFLSGPQAQTGGYSDQVIRYLMSQLALDQAANQLT